MHSEWRFKSMCNHNSDNLLYGRSSHFNPPVYSPYNTCHCLINTMPLTGMSQEARSSTARPQTRERRGDLWITTLIMDFSPATSFSNSLSNQSSNQPEVLCSNHELWWDSICAGLSTVGEKCQRARSLLTVNIYSDGLDCRGTQAVVSLAVVAASLVTLDSGDPQGLVEDTVIVEPVWGTSCSFGPSDLSK